jgi:hypothetical protein
MFKPKKPFCLLSLYLIDETLNLIDKHGKIRTAKTVFWCWNAIILDIWWNMFVVRIRALQDQVIWMRLCIIPV